MTEDIPLQASHAGISEKKKIQKGITAWPKQLSITLIALLEGHRTLKT